MDLIIFIEIVIDVVSSSVSKNEKVLSFQLAQGNGSGFASDKHQAFKGIGCNYFMVMLDANKSGRYNSSNLIPVFNDFSRDQVVEKSHFLSRCLLMNVDGSKIHETGNNYNSTQINHLDKIVSIFQDYTLRTHHNKGQIDYVRKIELCNRNCFSWIIS
jgi:hypothetical protein